MSVLKAIILGIVQGLTEFLPVSSSGHLSVTQMLLNLPEDRILFLTVMLHLGTLISVFFIYASDIYLICKEFILMLLEVFKGKGIQVNNEHRKLGVLIIIATIPTGLMGIFLKDIFVGFYNSSLIIGISLIITGTLLWTAEKIHSGKRSIKQMNWFDAVIVGVFQGLAITPGISRSGATIVGSLFRGFNKELATKFSFLISIPSIGGAVLLEMRDAITYGTGDMTFAVLLAGILASFLSGIFAIRTLINFIKKEKLYYFSYYTWTIGSIIVIFNIVR
ncbi:Undecaprenyl-diphosphatase [Natronincola peptidivorans]|uniref:Undecaprenyl-diphosphatase n=1 Tax=Natronincola peptidivorans TaxID=426128 RepID=A0A1I0G254_9FIRM|nr:undecaprenyl-diphosphate phosphatase [Natronincola peptidivorans]SET63947.1 Undecaprenyl-diphosphatase [Natronincola peptidivorans]